MSDSPNETAFRVEAAAEEDWQWIAEGFVEAAWSALPPAQQQEAARDGIRRSLEGELAGLRDPQAPPSQALAAKTSDGRPAGAIWAVTMLTGFQQQPTAVVMAAYVAEPYRDQGVGRLLLEKLEAWARQSGLPRIQLSLAPGGSLHPELAESLGYHVEKVQMTKTLSP